MLFVIKHQLSIIVKHEHRQALLKKWQNTYTKTPSHYSATIDPKRTIKMSSKAL